MNNKHPVNLLFPFRTPTVLAIVDDLSAGTTDSFDCWFELEDIFGGQAPNYFGTERDTVVIDLDIGCRSQDPAVYLEAHLAQLDNVIELCKGVPELNTTDQSFVFFSAGLMLRLSSPVSWEVGAQYHEVFKSLDAKINQAFPLDHAVLLPPSPPLRSCPGSSGTAQDAVHTEVMRGIVQAVANVANLSKPISSTPKETTPMNYHLTRTAVQTLDNVPDNVKEVCFEFKDNTHVVGSYYENKEGGLKTKIELWSLPVEEFFNLPPTRGVLQLLNLYVLAKQDGLSLADSFNGTFDNYVQMRRNEASPMVTKPKLAAMWHNPAGVVGVSTPDRSIEPQGSSTGIFRDHPAAFDTCRDLPRIDPSLAPESIVVVRSKYLTILKHVANVKRWMALFMHLSKEEPARKDELVATLAEYTQVGTITVVMPFFVQALLTDEFLAAKQDSQYLGVVFSVEPQTKLGEVDVKCVFTLD